MDRAIEEYIAWKGTYASRAAVSYRAWLVHFKKVCGSKYVEQYAIGDIVKYKHWLEEKYSPYSVEFGMIVMHNFFKYWKMQGKDCLSPDLIKVKKVYARSHRAVTHDEYRRILARIPEENFINLRDRLALSMLWDTGIRISELTSLTVEQFDRSSRKTVIKNAKNANSRIIVWSEETQALLHAYLPVRAILTNTSPLFVSACMKGITRLSARHIQRTIKYYASKAGIYEKITPHSFRHGWAHHRLDQRASLPFIQRGLGHKNPMSTHIYLQYTDVDFETQAQEYL